MLLIGFRIDDLDVNVTWSEDFGFHPEMMFSLKIF